MRKISNEELNRCTVEEYQKLSKFPITIVLDNVRSFNNVGSIFRTCDAFLMQKIYLCGITGVPPHREIHKTALGATESVDWQYFEKTIDAVKYLISEDYIVISVEQVENSIMLDKLNLEKNKKYAFVFGNEVLGVEQEVVDASNFCVEIPQLGTKHSINIAVSAGMVLWEIFKLVKN